MDKTELEQRTKHFAMRVIDFVSTLPRSSATAILGAQLLKSGTSIGANYREANRAYSKKDFIHRVGIVEKEASETLYWLELLDGLQAGAKQKMTWLLKEADELTAIFTAIGRTCKKSRTSRTE
jgi:four helix bundle protein